MIIRRADVPNDQGNEGRADELGSFTRLPYSNAGGLTRYGVYVETLEPGSRSSVRHWHENEDELLYVLSGEVTIVEDDGEHVLVAGDAACWPAGVANAHCAVNRSERACSYLIMGDRPSHDVCHYPELGRVLHTEGKTWRLVDVSGATIKSGTL
jgi:uncharacterized cupin superfamily protein